MSTSAHGKRLLNSKRSRVIAREQHLKRSRTFFAAGIAALIVLFVVATVVSGPGSDPVEAERETAPVSIAGDALPPLADGDTGIGLAIPEISGRSFRGDRLSIERDGIPKMILFLAHWCPHCQKEVPIIQSWLETEGAPHGVELVSVATATDRGQGNYPPSQWLQAEGWTVPVIADDEQSSAGTAFGVDSYPFFVFVDEEGHVHHRASGELTIEHIEGILDEMITEH